MENVERKRTIIWDDPKNSARDAASISGLDYLKAIKDGKISPPPVAMLLGYKLYDVENGHAVFELAPGEHHYNPFATVHGGIISTLLDTTMTASVLSTLQKGLSCSTVEIKMNFVRPITAKTEVLRCEARPIHVGKRLATVEGRLKDKNGVLYAHGVSTCSIFKMSTNMLNPHEKQ
ncbi:MAG: PaaI family thioesterase [Desulfobacteraceae bacterium]|nr:PaaI family thioesterase [Desulfobacteraceae bacterium]